MKVLHITESLGGGVYTYFNDLSEFMLSKGFNKGIENILIYSPKRVELDKVKMQNELSEAFLLHEVCMEREISPFKDLKAVFNLIREIKKIQPDILHLHSSKAGVLGRIASIFFPKIKVYYTPHGYSFVREDISKSKKKLFWNIEKYVSRIFGGTTIACGDTEYEFAEKLGPSLLIRNGVRTNDISEFKLAGNNNINNGEIIIGTIGRLSAQKNPELFNQVARYFPEIKFIWIGDGELRNSLNSNNIRVTGWLDKKDVLEITNSFNIYIQTSLWEGLPFTILEAMSLGKPIVATNVIGNKDAVLNGVNGYLCNNANDFKIAISKILLDKELYLDFSNNSLHRAKSKFDLETNFGRLIEIYLSN